LCRFQFGFVWRLLRFLVLLSEKIRIRLCHRLAALACYVATQAHPVLVIRPHPPSTIWHPASAICHPPVGIRYPPSTFRHYFRRHLVDTCYLVSRSARTIPRRSGPPYPGSAELVRVPASGIAISGGLVSACQRTHTPGSPSAWRTRGPESHSELSRTLRTVPTY